MTRAAAFRSLVLAQMERLQRDPALAEAPAQMAAAPVPTPPPESEEPPMFFVRSRDVAK